MAAELIGAGIDVHAIYRRLYEGVPQGKLELLARGLSAVERFDGGLLTRHPAHARGLRRDRRGRELLRGRRRPPARGRGDRGRRPGARPALRHRRDAAQGVAARDRRPRRRLGDRPRPGRRRAPPRGRLLDRPGVPRARRVPARRARRSSFDVPPTASCWSTSPPGSPRTTWWRRSARRLAARHEGRPRGHAGPVRDRPAARADRARDARAAVPDGAAQALRDGRAAGLDVDHRRPRGRDRAGPDAGRAARAADRAGSASARPPTRR